MGVPQSSNKKQKLNKESISNNKQLSAKVWFNAVRDGDLVIIERYLGSGWDVNAQEEEFDLRYGLTALHLSAQNGHLEIVKLLLEHGADVKAKTELFCETTLHLAARNGHFEIVKLLLEHGADVNAKTEIDHEDYRLHCCDELFLEGETVLHIAVRKRHIVIVKLLLEYGADVNAKTTDELTALHLSAQNGHLEIVKLLLEHGADVNSETVVIALEKAKRNGHMKVFGFITQWLEQKLNLDPNN